MSHIPSAELALWQAQDFGFELLDVRRAGVRTEQGAQSTGAHWHDPAPGMVFKLHLKLNASIQETSLGDLASRLAGVVVARVARRASMR